MARDDEQATEGPAPERDRAPTGRTGLSRTEVVALQAVRKLKAAGIVSHAVPEERDDGIAPEVGAQLIGLVKFALVVVVVVVLALAGMVGVYINVLGVGSSQPAKIAPEGSP